MSEKTVAWLMMGIGTGQVLLLVAALATLRDDDGLSKAGDRPVKDEGVWRRLLTAAHVLGVRIVSALDDALARVATFVKDVVTQLKAAKSTNDTQTGKLAELEAALGVALSDDAADKAQIAALQAEIGSLQESVAAQINAAVDALQNPPAVEEAPVVESPAEAPVQENPVEAPADETPADGVVSDVTSDSEGEGTDPAVG